MGKKYVGYIRVSDTRGREETLISDDVQRADIEAYAQLLKVEIVEWRTDLDRTGRNMHREGFLEAVELVETGAVDGLVVARLNRFARNVADATAIVKRIERAGGEFASAHERLDSGTYGKFTRTLFFAMGELESDIIADNWRAAQSMAISQGRSVTPWAAAGFELVAEPGSEPAEDKVQKWLIPHTVFAPIIAEAFERRANGCRVAETAEFLNRHEVPNSRGRTHWTTAEASRLLARRIYIGELRHGDVMHQFDHLAIVEPHIFERVQQMRAVREPRAPRHGSGYLLSGIARCAGCGHTLRGHIASAAMVRKGSKADYYYYRCTKSHSGGVCDAVAHANGEQLEAFATERMFEVLGDMQADSLGSSDELDAAVAVRDAALAELGAFVALESALGEHYLAGFQSKEGAVREADDEVDAIRTRSGASALPSVAKLRAEFDTWPLDEQRKLFTMATPCVMVRKSPRLTPIERRTLCIPRDRLHEVDLPSRGNGSDGPVLRTFTWTD